MTERAGEVGCRDCFVHYRHGDRAPWVCPACSKVWTVTDGKWTQTSPLHRDRTDEHDGTDQSGADVSRGRSGVLSGGLGPARTDDSEPVVKEGSR